MAQDISQDPPPAGHRGISLRNLVENAATALDTAATAEPVDRNALAEARQQLARLQNYCAASRLEQMFWQAAPLIYLVMIGVTEIAFIELYCLWHGTSFLSLQLFSAENVRKLAGIDFVRTTAEAASGGGTAPKITTMAVAAEVFMWSSLGVWAQRSFTMVVRYTEQRPEPLHDMSVYIGAMIRNTSSAAIVLILLRLANLQVFGVSLNEFESVVSLAFLLGFFGDDTFRLMSNLKSKIFGQVDEI